MLGVALALGSAVAHTGWNTLSKAGAAGGTAFVWLSTAVGPMVALPVAVVVVLAQGSVPAWSWIGAGAVGAVLHGGYMLVLQAGYRRGEVSVVYPVSRGLAPVLVAVLGVALFRQPLGIPSGVGVALIAASVLLLLRDGSGDGRGRGVGWGALTAVVIAAYTLWDAAVVVSWGIPPLPYYAVVAVLQLGMISVVARRHLGAAATGDRRRLGLAAVVGVLIPLSYVLSLVALEHAPVAEVAALRSTSIVMSGIVAWLALGERLSARRVASTALATGAVLLIAVSST
ncbi:drug/metabolite transporter (DMT)-like permease [Clavibacter michiganensis]|uniref:DMT family transporter n=1 Tax=Clavibacter michiganensis TaxID=28447 RepID=UPI00195EBDF9|nr:DMT family transporter [Clavibacter michiganensis]MBM7412034.1 drug/metabolite transporter (DMT)-like permease [Clavibacter michiganensis]